MTSALSAATSFTLVGRKTVSATITEGATRGPIYGWFTEVLLKLIRILPAKGEALRRDTGCNHVNSRLSYMTATVLESSDFARLNG